MDSKLIPLRPGLDKVNNLGRLSLLESSIRLAKLKLTFLPLPFLLLLRLGVPLQALCECSALRTRRTSKLQRVGYILSRAVENAGVKASRSRIQRVFATRLEPIVVDMSFLRILCHRDDMCDKTRVWTRGRRSPTSSRSC